MELFLNLDWPTFLFAMLLIELTPGPNMGWLTLLSAQHGARVGLTAVLGIALGLAVQVIVAATGLSALMTGYPILYEGLRWGGVLFMIWLAWQAFVENGSATPAIGLQEKGFRRGFIANLLNPKALVFYAVVIGQFTDPTLGSVWWQILTLGILHIGIATLVHLILALLGTRIGDGIETWRTSYTARIFFSVSLFAVAIWIAVSTA